MVWREKERTKAARRVRRWSRTMSVVKVAVLSDSGV
jgi:hypothetical protein